MTNFCKNTHSKIKRIKKAFLSLYSCLLIFDAIKRISKFKNMDIIDFELLLKIFIAGGKFRKEHKEFYIYDILS